MSIVHKGCGNCHQIMYCKFHVGFNNNNSMNITRCSVYTFRLYFSVIRMGSHCTFVLCTANSRCKEIAVPGATVYTATCTCLYLCDHAASLRYVSEWRLVYYSLVPRPTPFCSSVCIDTDAEEWRQCKKSYY